MNAALWRIRGMGELVYELNNWSSRKTRSPLGCWSLAELGLCPNRDAACAIPDDDLFKPCVLVMSVALVAGLAVLPEWIILDIEGGSRAVGCFVADRAHCRHMVTSAARAAASSGRGMLSNRGRM